MPKQSVDDFLDGLNHRRRGDVDRLRAIIRTADSKLNEAIKWNAPSYGYTDDRITFRLQPGDRVELILHRGAKVKSAEGFRFDDASGLLRMLAPDRGIVEFESSAMIEANADALRKLVVAWMKATT